MSSFTEALVARKSAGRTWVVVEPFTYVVGDYETSTETITVPKGFETDLASIPRAFWSIAPPDDSYAQAAVLNDWLCWTRGWSSVVLRGPCQFYSVRRTSDVFNEAMGVLGVAPWKRAIMFRAVLMFGPKWKP